MSAAEEAGETTEYVQSLSSKEIKKLAKPEFAANPDKFYPTATLRKLGFHRASCPECGNNYWRTTEARNTCGDSQCVKRYSFIGVGTGVGRGPNARKLTYAEAWQGFRRSLSTARVPCTPIARYPVVARWRADVDYVAAGIFCFQPYCVSGEMNPPANPLICPQFCLRFNDLDNIGLTGRHYSGFVMLGIQVFNKPNDRKFWADECVEFNYRWLTEELGIAPDEITFIEDVWAGGGNLGPSIEYFVGGLELGNMVFMQYKTFPDGRREPLQVQVIDVGIGLERVPWLINGSPTSYVDVFPTALAFMQSKINLPLYNDVWEKFGPLSCLLNVDEAEDLTATWEYIGKQIGMPGAEVKSAVEPVRDMYTILDHTRSVLMAVYDGSLPSNVGGAANVRNILRRVFSLLKKRKWWDLLGMDGLLTLFDAHKTDLAQLYSTFQEYKSFRPIIELEFERWTNTDKEQKEKLDKLVKKKKGALTIDDWIVAVTSYGIPEEVVTQVTGLPIPGNLYYEIADRQERSVKAVPTELYSTAHLPETVNMYYQNHRLYEFTGVILEVMRNVTDNNKPNIVVLDRSAFYPTSGGQEHDGGSMTIDGVVYDVVDVIKAGPCVLHVLSAPLPNASALDSYKGKEVHGSIDVPRRAQLRNHHTATHIVYASCRRVLGPHVWQNGAKKTTQQAHLDITHYQSLSYEQVLAIQLEANRIVQSSKQINKGFMAKDEAEKKFGFHLYQGGIVPGNQLRVVNIVDTDTEACCGTHADNTSEVGLIKIIKTARISDGIVRLYFVAGELALSLLNSESQLLNRLTSEWGVNQDELLPTADRFFDGYKKFSALASKQAAQLLDLHVKVHVLDPSSKLLLLRSSELNATMYIANMPNFAAKLTSLGKGVVVVGDSFVYGLLGSAELYDAKTLEADLRVLVETEEKDEANKAAKKKGGESSAAASSSSSAGAAAAAAATKKPVQVKIKDTLTVSKGKDKSGKKVSAKITGLVEFVVFSLPCKAEYVSEYFGKKGFVAPSEEEQ